MTIYLAYETDGTIVCASSEKHAVDIQSERYLRMEVDVEESVWQRWAEDGSRFRVLGGVLSEEVDDA